MSDWIEIDYDDRTTWFKPGDRVQYLRHLGPTDGWVLIAGVVHAPHDEPDKMSIEATIDNHGSIFHHSHRLADWPDGSGDWWRRDPMLELEDRHVVR